MGPGSDHMAVTSQIVLILDTTLSGRPLADHPGMILLGDLLGTGPEGRTRIGSGDLHKSNRPNPGNNTFGPAPSRPPSNGISGWSARERSENWESDRKGIGKNRKHEALKSFNRYHGVGWGGVGVVLWTGWGF